MKSTVMFLGILFGLTFLVSCAMLVTATMKPQWFMLGGNHAQADTLQAGARKDSLSALAHRDSTGAGHQSHDVKDSVAAPPVEQAAAVSPKAVPQKAVPSKAVSEKAAERKPAESKPVPAAEQAAATQQKARAAEVTKQDDLQNLVKLYEAMKPEDAAKILAKQQDKEIRSIILHIKKKQAAKILANFNAERAAQILGQ